ncbi:hypothetical protein JCM10914A_04280 [Paenibacillus sp. JCM 10914]|uniref:DUF948 domain-containing protein n=1 Tax=Paenibacillus sp. JCM 10914 TaxID=1236974 RepID=UPI0003CC5331|nr:DUF948 domain-containing protein [Paenibacillus sp. JCM 10914]GAE07889.1 hypothetical protein JCM10914_4137 [Paenibacillus sp. JCM 10914]
MAEWSVLIASAAFVFLAVIAVWVLLSVKRLVRQAEGVLGDLARDSAQLAQEASVVLEQSTQALTMVQRQLATSEAITASMSDAAAAVVKTANAVQTVGEKASITAIEHLERARLENERQIGEIFRWVDAGMTIWHTWSNFTSKSDKGQAK